MGRLRLGVRIGAIALVAVAALALLATAASARTVHCQTDIPFGTSSADCTTQFEESSDLDYDDLSGLVNSTVGVVEGYTIQWIDQSQDAVVVERTCGLSAGASFPNFDGSHQMIHTGIGAGDGSGDTQCDETVTPGNYDEGAQTLKFHVELVDDHSCIDRPTREADCLFRAELDYRLA